jgi:phosphoribosylformylglycinamidine cyclo-ligase|tara:strand:+ start:207 stop:1124 length:918 start_codon:yes stop_codon:yes gene_type:complete
MKYSVDIEAGNAFVERLKEKAPSIGGFGGAFKIPAGYEKPVLVSGTDGVGTKINIARIFMDYTTIGIDLVAMCVNDVICTGAKPLYFLDYISTKKLDDNVDQIMEGIIKGCEIAGVELIGGETAEHYRQNEYDLAGFCTGIVEENEVIDGRIIKPGDIIIGIESSGLHSNGYSLINDMLWRHKIYYKETPELLTPTTIYAPVVRELLEHIPVLGMAHITGGGIPENLPRCLPKGVRAQVDYNSWRLPDIFNKVMLAGEIPEEEMKMVFNLGIGYCVVVPPEVEDEVKMIITPYHECWTIGEVVVE